MSTKSKTSAYKGKPVILMKRISTIFLALVISFSLHVACSSEEATGVVDPELAIYFDLFEKEANTRGMSIALDEIAIGGVLKSINDGGVVGQCVSNTELPNEIIIDKEYWSAIDELQREFLVFHELGHCILGRSHTDDRYLNGTCKSIMHSGANVCRSNYTIGSREDYLDELFGK